MDATGVRVKEEQVGIRVVVGDQSGDLSGLEIVVSENMGEVREIVEQVAKQVDAEVLVSDDMWPPLCQRKKSAIPSGTACAGGSRGYGRIGIV
jgi:hypothetical protein